MKQNKLNVLLIMMILIGFIVNTDCNNAEQVISYGTNIESIYSSTLMLNSSDTNAALSSVYRQEYIPVYFNKINLLSNLGVNNQKSVSSELALANYPDYSSVNISKYSFTN